MAGMSGVLGRPASLRQIALDFIGSKFRVVADVHTAASMNDESDFVFCH